MSLLNKILLLSSVFLLTNSYAAEEDEDVQSLRDWLNSKRLITVNRDYGGTFSLSSDIHFVGKTGQTKKNWIPQKRVGTDEGPSSCEVKSYLTIDYQAEDTWAVVKLKMENTAGIYSKTFGTGTNHKLKLDYAYSGYRLFKSDWHNVEIEIGRRGQLSGFYDSRIGFSSNFDGINFKNNYIFREGGSCYLQVGAFLINKDRHQLGYVGEVGFLDIGNTGLYAKYSLIDWDTYYLREIPAQFKFIVSHLTLGYKWTPVEWNKPITIYAAGICNHKADASFYDNHNKENEGGYIGFSIGKLKKKGDWSFDANYQVLQAQALPEFDVQGVGLGSKNHFYYKSDKDLSPNTLSTAEGNVNFLGFEVIFQYLITSNVNIFQKYKYGQTLNRDIGPYRTHYQYEIDIIYLF